MITIVHIDTERTWRGGEGQVLNLALKLPKNEFRSIIAAPRKSALMDRAHAAGLDTLVLPSTAEFSFSQLRILRRIIQRESVSIMHVHTSHGLIAAALIRELFKKDLKIVYARRTDFKLRTQFLGLSRRKYQWGADLIVCVSERIRQILLKAHLSAEKIITIYSGVDLGRFCLSIDRTAYRQSLGLNPDHIIVGMVAALEPHKDPMIFIRAVDLVLQKRKDVSFVLVGNGSLWDEVESYAKENLPVENFKMLGFRTDIPEILHTLDIFCMSSKEEGLCTSILDAMASGLPVVATSAGGIPEVVSNGETGILTPIENAPAFADGVLNLISHETQAKQMGIKGLERVRSRFSIERTVEKTADAYRKILKIC